MRYIITSDRSPRRYSVVELQDETEYFSKEVVAQIRNDVAGDYGETVHTGVTSDEKFTGTADEVMLYLRGDDKTYGDSVRFIGEAEYDKIVLEKHQQIEKDKAEYADLLEARAAENADTTA
jgi:hypothetical protein